MLIRINWRHGRRPDVNATRSAAPRPNVASRVYCTGYSLGACGCLIWASSYPGRFAAIAPVCIDNQGWWMFDLGDSRSSTNLLIELACRGTGVRAYHGTCDQEHPWEASQNLVDQLLELNPKLDAEYVPILGAGHRSWLQVFDDAYGSPKRGSNLIGWFLTHGSRPSSDVTD